MEVLKGIPVSPGIAIGQAFLLDSEGVRIPEHFIRDDQVEHEVSRLEWALDRGQQELEDLAAEFSQKASSSIGEIFMAHAGILNDKEFRESLCERIRTKNYTAEFAVSRTMRQWRKIFREDPQSLFASRVADLDDLERRLLGLLLGEKREELESLRTEVLLVAHDLGPSETASVDPDKVKGFAIDAGGPTSHTAIIARALGIPAVVGLETLSNELSGGDELIIDGSRGLVVINPDDETVQSYSKRRDEALESDKILQEEVADLPAVTSDGRRITLLSNIDSAKEISRALTYGAEGIGLFRTEYLFLLGDEAPDEEAQSETYINAVEELEGRPIVIRTLDLGADKFMRGRGDPTEKNPFLGRRSIRYCLDHPDLLRTQMRAIVRASSHGNVKVMFPLITTVDELVKSKEMLAEVQAEFEERGEDYDPDMEVGIMIEVPSAAICADCLAREADFFSIGTNDLIQYTLAIDRANEHVAHLYKPSHPAVLRLIKMTVDAAERAGIPVSLCGEMASDVMYATLLVGLGIDQFSIAPPTILPEIKKIIRGIEYSAARESARAILESESPEEAFQALQEKVKEQAPNVFP